MSAVAFLWFEGFYCSSWLRSHPEFRAKPFAILHDRRVLDASTPARRSGIRPGMTAPEARYVARGCDGDVRFIDYREADFAGYAEAHLDICAEYASAVEPVGQHAAFLDLGMLAGAREIAFSLGADLFRAAKLCARIGIAGSRLVSRIAAERCAGDAEIVKTGYDAVYMRDLPIEYLWQISPLVLSRIRNLGHRTIGEVASLDPTLLRKHFGDDGHVMWDLANGRDHSIVPAVYPPHSLAAKFHFPQPARLHSEVDAGVMALANGLGECLRERQQQCKEILITVALEDGSMITSQREFTNAMTGFGGVLTGIRLTLRKIVAHTGIQSLSVSLRKVSTIDNRQIVIPGSSVKDGEQDVIVERADQAVRGLQKQFGDTTIRRGDGIEPSRRQRVMRAWKEATGW